MGAHFLLIYIRYILHRMEGGGDEVCPEALARGGVYVICPICFEKKREREGYSSSCCGQPICKCCGDNHRDTCKRRSLEFTCPYCRALILDEEGNKRLMIKHGDTRVLVYMTHILVFNTHYIHIIICCSQGGKVMGDL